MCACVGGWRGGLLLLDMVSGSWCVWAPAASQPGRTDSVAPLHRWRMEASGDSSWSCVRRIIRGPSQRFWEPCSCLERAWEVGHPGAHGGQTPSLLCLRVVQRHRARAPTGFGIKEPGPQQTCSLRPWTFLCPCSAPSQINPLWLSTATESRLWRQHGLVPEELRVQQVSL